MAHKRDVLGQVKPLTNLGPSSAVSERPDSSSPGRRKGPWLP
ncbi:MAG: hypothetical protein QOE65_2940 [Solirubrobacteraceae bacterium]|jgi:hypothetical protein|nr:hypothetical protein [Solirubrobacteraceae bacterium]